MKKVMLAMTSLVFIALNLTACFRGNDPSKEIPNKPDENVNKELSDSDEVPFVDPEFKRMCIEYLYTTDGTNYLPAIDKNQDGKITVGEAKAFNGNIVVNAELEVEPYNIKSAVDLKWFPNITSFALAKCPELENIDLSNNLDIETLTLFNTRVKNIDVRKQSKLKNFTVADNTVISNIDLSQNKNLEFLMLDGLSQLNRISTKLSDKLQYVTISNIPSLNEWELAENNDALIQILIDSTNLALAPMLDKINNVTSLTYGRSKATEGTVNLSKLSKLENVTLFFNPAKDNVTGIIFPENPRIESVTINGSHIENFDMTSLSQLKYCDVGYSNMAKRLDISNGNNSNLNFLLAKYSPLLTCIQIDDTMPLPIDLQELANGQVYWYVDHDGGEDENLEPIGNPIPTFSHDCNAENGTNTLPKKEISSIHEKGLTEKANKIKKQTIERILLESKQRRK